ncbi:transcriptional regulator LldR [Comamonas flocculans]|uniref:Transcriptional regulator LldR n=1 Tax=Comamonas flocculans TaxID=2597701 RepID=A0A5B8S1Q6_9BURK|nr:transcriptional regulator LldR [Comamonas flocculans]QEA14617.1 transcriptional regulator LldR [Comamonas flocculans]
MRLADHVVEKVLALVQSRRLQPGQRLPAERRLAEDLGVSRTSVREAIQKLTSQGILASRRGDGTYLQTHPTAEWLRGAMEPLAGLIDSDPHYRYDVLETRHALETSTAWLAAQRATAQDKTHIRRCFNVMLQYQRSGHAELAARADAQFHLAIAEASHNLVLVQVMHSLFTLMLSTVERNRLDMFRLSAPQTLQELTQQHEDLMLAVLEGDPQRARSSIGVHLEHVRATIVRLDEDAARRERSMRLPVDLAPTLLPDTEPPPTDAESSQ